MLKQKTDLILTQIDLAGDLALRKEACAADVVALARLVDETGFFTIAEQRVAVELLTERLARGDASGYEFWFLDAGQGLVAYICYGQIPCTLASYDIYWIAVSPAMQGKGFGTFLLQQTEDSIKKGGGQQIYIETSSREQYNGTRRFYLASAYQEVSRLKNFYAPGDDRVTYAKAL